LLRDLTDVVGGFEATDAPRRTAPDEMRGELPAAIVAVANLVASPVHGVESPERLIAAEKASLSLDERAAGLPSSVAHAVTASVCLERIVESARPFVAARESRQSTA
jgi:hypothetical protein